MQLNFEQLHYMENLFPEYTGILIPVPIKLQEIFLSCINMHTVTIIHNSVFYT